MTVSGSRRRPLALRLSLTAAIAVTVAGSSVAFASPAVSAPLPVRTAAAPAFTAGLCEGTEYTPSEQMLDISGVRLDHYNDGNIVPMYGTTDRGTSTAVDAPVCGVRDVDGIAKSEWMYCTDFDLDPCSGVDENGLPVDKCQWPRSSPRRRPVVLPAGGHGFSPVAASCFSPPAF